METKLVTFILVCALWHVELCLSSGNFTLERKWWEYKELQIRCVDTSKLDCQNEKYRTIDGSCNNPNNPAIGMAYTAYKRLLPPDYGDKIYSMPVSVTNEELPSARRLSYKVFGRKKIGDPNYTNLNQQWGQFVVHDVSLRLPDEFPGLKPLEAKVQRCCTGYGRYEDRISTTPCFPIPVPRSDPYFVNDDCIDFDRSITEKDQKCSGSEDPAPAEQLNGVTHYMDLSVIYGNSIEDSQRVREFDGGFLQTNDYNRKWPPRNDSLCLMGNPDELCYDFGDVRGNQNLGLATISIVFVREHNRLASKLGKMNKHWDDEKVFQEARRINIAQFQYITFYEWNLNFYGYERLRRLGIIYDTNSGEHVSDYSPNVDPRSIQEFHHASFRYFHHQIMGHYQMATESRKIKSETLRLTRFHDKPGILEIKRKFNKVLRGLSTQHMALTDENVNIEVAERFVLGAGLRGKDLKSFDIQRGRDHGLPRYNVLREFCGLKRAKRWSDYTDLISEEDVEVLRSIYKSYEDVDLLIGGSLERDVPGTFNGPTFLCINLIQFHNLRKGDRYFFENEKQPYPFTPDQLLEIRKASAARLMCDNSDIKKMQPKAFELLSEKNSLRNCTELPEVDLSKWKDKKYLKDKKMESESQPISDQNESS